MPRNGWLRSDLPVGHIYFGYLVRCPDCQDQRIMADRLRAKSQLSGWLTSATFENFDPLPGNQAALAAAKLMATLSRRGWLTLWGGRGCGKTHLLAATVNYALTNQINAVYFTLAELLAQLRHACGTDGALEQLVDDVERADLLALDEIDTDKINLTDFAAEQMYRIFDARYRDIHLRTTILAAEFLPGTNTPGALGYLWSRMQDGRNAVIEITTGDVRPHQVQP